MTDSLVARLREAIDTEQLYAETADHLSRQDSVSLRRRCAADRKILDRAEQVLTAGTDDRDADGVLLSVPIARRHMRATVRDLAEAYGVEA